MNQPMEYTLKNGEIVSDLADFIGIVKYYEAYCTAEYIEYEWNIPEEICLDLGYEVRRRMDKYKESDEDEAIEHYIFGDFCSNLINWLENLEGEYAKLRNDVGISILQDGLVDMLDAIYESEPLKEKFFADKYQLI